jgi:hypothetical protein
VTSRRLDEALNRGRHGAVTGIPSSRGTPPWWPGWCLACCRGARGAEHGWLGDGRLKPLAIRAAGASRSLVVNSGGRGIAGIIEGGEGGERGADEVAIAGEAAVWAGVGALAERLGHRAPHRQCCERAVRWVPTPDQGAATGGKGPSASCVATYVVRNLPEGPVATLETVCANAIELAEWTENWLRAQLDRIKVRSADAEYNAAFMYLAVATNDPSRPCLPTTWRMEEFGNGCEPHAPSDWPEIPLVDLVGFAITDLGDRDDG